MVELLKGFGAKENTSETNLNLSNAMKLERIKNIKADMHKTFKVLEYTNYSADSDVKHSDFSLHQMIGKGSFGEVYLVEHKETKVLYAMKVFSKKTVQAQNLMRFLKVEKKIMEDFNHPF